MVADEIKTVLHIKDRLEERIIGQSHALDAIAQSIRTSRARMTDPRKPSGPDPEYTQAALDHEIEGTMLVRCVVGLNGKVRDCQVLKALPFMDHAVLDALERRTYSPALLDGKPIEVEYTFRIQLKLPE